jgi:hypothetical protein
MAEGSVVSVLQIDEYNKKVLLDFGGGLIDWVSRQTVRGCFNKVIDDE